MRCGLHSTLRGSRSSRPPCRTMRSAGNEEGARAWWSGWAAACSRLDTTLGVRDRLGPTGSARWRLITGRHGPEEMLGRLDDAALRADLLFLNVRTTSSDVGHALRGGLRMPAYLIVENEVTDPAGFEEYRKQVPGTVEKYGGKFLVRGGQMQTLEGDWKPNRIVVTEFPSIEQARRWYDSEEYRALKALRLRTARSSVVLVEGV
jgi:uncharacterized protein (DUF1330 family)